MSNPVGIKGQVVIDQKIRKALGITPGSHTIQRIADDHVEIRFLPAEHNRSLKGILRPFIKSLPNDPDKEADAWSEEAAQRYREGLP